jgi:hypothetical protein
VCARPPFPTTPAAGKLTGQSKSGKNFSTIPSKFETTLFTGNKERDGFGSRAHRFVDVENDLPGPGTYDDGEKKLRDDKVYSKKGLGVGFVSRTKRDSGFKATSSAPGPGNYERGGSFYDGVREANRANRSGSTTTFKPPSQRSVMVASDPNPGPTDYTIPRSFDAKPALSSTEVMEASVFRSGSVRGAGMPGRFVSPAPGQYDPRKPGDTLDATLPTAAFRSNVPIAGRGGIDRLTREQQLGVVSHTPAVRPGPGHYELPASSAERGAHRRMPQFFDSSHDRFGAVVGGSASAKYSTPGPGAYASTTEERETALISGSAFMSGTLRGGRSSRDVVPGPAYYSPAVDAKKSYHLNARQRWVPT